jgi:hypothetical protein
MNMYHRWERYTLRASIAEWGFYAQSRQKQCRVHEVFHP